MPVRLLLVTGLGVMDDGDEPIAISPDVEDYIPIHVIGILEHLTHFRETVPANSFNDGRPSLNLTRCILVLLHGLVQMLAGNDIHSPHNTSQFVKLSSARKESVRCMVEVRGNLTIVFVQQGFKTHKAANFPMEDISSSRSYRDADCRY